MADLEHFKNLAKKVEYVLKAYNEVKQDKERIEAHIARQDREHLGIKRQLEKALKEKEMMKKRLDSIIKKIESLDLQ